MQQRHGSLESSILNALWGLEDKNIYTNSVKDIYEILAKNPDEKRAYTTLKTVMDRLVEKKVLLRYKQDKKFYYRTAYSKSEIIKKSLKIIADRYCKGDYNELINILNTMTEHEFILH